METTAFASPALDDRVEHQMSYAQPLEQLQDRSSLRSQ